MSYDENLALTPTSIAKHFGVTKQAINFHLKNGVLVKNAEGKINLKLAEAAFTALDPAKSKIKKTNRLEAVDENVNLPATSQPSASTLSETISSYNESKALREHEEAIMAQLKRKQIEGSLIDRGTFERVAFNAGVFMREIIMTTPDKISAALASTSDEFECRQLLSKTLREALDVSERLSQVELTRALQESTNE